ncbi:MAG: aldehyde dehydrogenase family protein [Verrucomicrobiota bacterium]
MVLTCIEFLRTQAGEEIPMGLNPASAKRLAFTSHEPIGLVLAYSAFNHPLNLIIHQIVPAIAVGCPIIIKPALDTPLTCFRLVELFHEAGLPPEYCQAITLKDLDLATKLVSDQRIAFFSFIGSPAVGWMLRSKLAPGARCALEHGGAAPVIFTEDADIENAADGLVKGAFYHAGQVCVSVQRIFIHVHKIDFLSESITEAAKKLVIGDPIIETTEVGPLIRPREVDRVAEWVSNALNEGARKTTGGNKIFESCYEPTVLLNPSVDSKVSKQEIFGPVVCLYSYTEIDKAIEQANSLPFSFQASVFSSDIDTISYCYKRLNASAVIANDHTAFRVDWMPFAGLKTSGLGTGGIPYTMRDLQTKKMLVIKSPKL